MSGSTIQIRGQATAMDFSALQQLLPRPHCSWTTEDLYVWLSFIGLEHLYPLCLAHHYNGQKITRVSSHFLISSLGITSKIQSKKLMKWRESLLDYDDYLRTYHPQQYLSPPREYGLFKRSFKKEPPTDDQHMNSKESTQANPTENSSFTDQQSTNGKKSKMPANKLIISECNTSSIACYEFEGRGGKFGRHSDNQVQATDSNVSYRHCQIIYQQPFYLLSSITDAETWIKIESKIELQEQMVIEMGSNQFRIKPSPKGIDLQVVKGEDCSDSFSFGCLEKIFIGRRTECQICMALDTTLSALHGRISFSGGKWYFQDMNTTNGSWSLLQRARTIEDGMFFRLGGANSYYKCKLSHSAQKKKNTYCEKCKKEEQNSYFTPCFHTVYCSSCAKDVQQCPICEGTVSEVMKIYSV